MAYTEIAKLAQGSHVPKSFLDAIVDNLTYFFNTLGGAGTSAGAQVLNGSFENDSDNDGHPDGWIETVGAGASHTIVSSGAAHGAKAYSIYTPGSVNSYADSEGYVACSPLQPLVIPFLLKATDAAAGVQVDVKWYDASKSPLSTIQIYSDVTNNPTDWAGYAPVAVPPAGAFFCSLCIYGGLSTVATAATVYFDGITIIPAARIGAILATIPQDSTSSSSPAIHGSTTLILPALSANGLARLTFKAESRQQTGSGSQYFKIGSDQSNTVEIDSATYEFNLFTIDVNGAGGPVTMYQYLAAESGTVYGRMLASEIQVEVIIR